MFRENWISWNLKWFLKTWECQKRWKRYHCCIEFADDWNFVAIAFLLNLDVMLSARQKGSPGSLCSWCCTLLEQFMLLRFLLKKGCKLSWDVFWMNRALGIWSSTECCWSPGCSCSALEVLNPGCDDDLLQKSSWDVQSFLAFPQEPKWV